MAGSPEVGGLECVSDAMDGDLSIDCTGMGGGGTEGRCATLADAVVGDRIDSIPRGEAAGLCWLSAGLGDVSVGGGPEEEAAKGIAGWESAASCFMGGSVL
jgi:hypothetical protein